MKKCPYCAEEIQDAAIKCKHCGEFLKPEQHFSPSTPSPNIPVTPKEEKKPIGELKENRPQYSPSKSNPNIRVTPKKEKYSSLFQLCVIFGVIAFMILAYLAFTEGKTYKAIATLGAGVIFIFIARLGWSMGDIFRKFAQPDLYFARGAVDLAKKKVFWMVGPQMVGVLIAFGILAYLVTIVWDDQIQGQIATISDSNKSSLLTTKDSTQNNQTINTQSEQLGTKKEAENEKINPEDLKSELSQQTEFVPKKEKEFSTFEEGQIVEQCEELWSKQNNNLFLYLKSDLGEIKQLDNKIKTLPSVSEVFPKSGDADGYTTYYIQKKENGKIAFINVSPLSLSGDWYRATTYYFDDNGNLRAVNFVDNSFNLEGEILDTSKMSKKQVYAFFDSNGNLVHEEVLTNLKDLQGKKGIYLQYKKVLYMTVVDLIKNEAIEEIIQ